MKPNTSREDQARAEIGVTDISPAAAWFLTVFFLALVFGVPVVQHAMGVREWLKSRRAGENVSLLKTEALGFYAKFAGVGPAMNDASRKAHGALDPILDANAVLVRAIKGFDDALDDATFLTPLTQQPVQALLCRLGAGNEKALLGRDGWLFYEPAVTSVSGPGFLEPRQLRHRTRAGVNADPVAAIADFHKQLAVRGIQLVVLPSPSKVTIHPEKLAGPGIPAPVQNASYETFVSRLKDAGVAVYDCAPLLAERARTTGPQYLSTDTHWRPEAVQAVANGLKGFFPIPEPATLTASNEFTRAAPVTITNRGDIAVMLKLPISSPRFAHETAVIAPVLRRGTEWSADKGADILLLGDSFSNIYSHPDLGWGTGAGLAEQLSFALQRPVDRIVRNDSGSFATREMLARELARGEDRLAGKRMVIWQFAARELAHGDWKPIELKVGKGARRTGTVEAGLRACGTVVAVSSRPLRSAVYRDFVIKFLVTGLKDERTGQQIAGGVGVVNALGMSNHAILPAANIKEGSVLRMRIWSWDDVKARYESLRAGDLPDPTVEIENPCFWGEVADGGVETAIAAVPEVAPVAAVTNVTGFLGTCGKVGVEAIAAERFAVEGRDGWLFISTELRHLGAGRFWGENALAASQAKDPGICDPTPAIVDFAKQLKASGIELILMPVPAKAVVYPDKTSADVKLDAQGVPPRTDVHHQAFYRMLGEQGVQVLDLTDDLIEARREDGREGPVYCMTDTHWSSRACALAARRIRERVEGRDWFRAAVRQEYVTGAEKKEIVGDLIELSGATNRAPEKIKLFKVGTGEKLDPVHQDETSPVLLLADSHGLVFHAGDDMHGTGAGLADHLARELGFAVDLMARRGSAATSVRIDLARRFKDESAQNAKKLVIWCFTARDFTESSGWRKVPLRLGAAKK